MYVRVKAMENDSTPVGKTVVTLAGCLGAFTLQNANVYLSTISAVVSIAVGLVTFWILVRKLTKGKDE